MSGSCAIYVPKRQLDVEKKMGGNQRSANFPLGFAPENGPPSKSGRRLQKIVFLGGHMMGSTFSGAKQSGKFPERRIAKLSHF